MWENLVEGARKCLVGSAWPQTVPLPAPELLLTSDSGAPTALDRLLLPLTCARFLIAGGNVYAPRLIKWIRRFHWWPPCPLTGQTYRRAEGVKGKGAGCLHMSVISIYYLMQYRMTPHVTRQQMMKICCGKQGRKLHIYNSKTKIIQLYWSMSRNYYSSPTRSHTWALFFKSLQP